MTPEYEFEFDIIREKYYSDYRFHFFNKLTKACLILGLIFMWVGGFGIENDTLSIIIEIMGSLLVIANTVLDFQSNAVFWKNMSNDYSSLYADFLKNKGNWNNQQINNFNANLELINSKDKEIKTALTERAHNAANRHFGCSHDYDFDIGWFKKITANIFDWDSGCTRYIDKKMNS